MTPGPGPRSSLPRKPALAPWCRLVHDDGRVLLERAGTLVTLEGAAANALLPRLLPLLDGTRSVDELVAQLGPAIGPAVKKALGLLAENELLVEGPCVDDGPATAAATYVAAVMLGLRRPDAGRVELCGRDPRDPAARRTVGAVLQDVGFPPGLRVRETVELVRAHFPDPASTAEILERLGLSSAAERYGGGLSGGQRRRLAVALALVGRPNVLFLDEPTTAMDAGARRELLDDLAEFAAQGGAVLLTTQQLAEAEEIATRVVLLMAGRAMLEGTVGQVRARGGLAKVTFRAAVVPRLDGATSVESRGDRHVVYVDDADAFVTELVRSGAAFRELEVTPVSLEDAFVSLTAAAR